MPRLVRATFTSVVLSASVAACSVSAVLDDSRLQQEIQTGFEAQTGLSAERWQTKDGGRSIPVHERRMT